MRFKSVKALSVFFILIIVASSAFAENPVQLSFIEFSSIQEMMEQNFSLEDSLSDMKGRYHERNVRIRGFLYQTQDGRWILSAEPNLKTCCVGSPAKALQQILVTGDFAKETLEPVTVEGIFLVEPVNGPKGTGQLFKLENAKIYQERSGGIPYGTLAIASLVLGGIAFFWVYRRKA